MTTALVLGGGGVTGIAWHLGVLCGLQRAGVSLAGADTMIGTSAGSVVATLLAAGTDLEAAVASQSLPAARPSAAVPSGAGSFSAAPPVPAAGSGSPAPSGRARSRDTGQILAAMGVLADPSIPPQQARAQVGEMALAASTQDEQTYLARMEPLVPVRDWPDRDLRLVVVDTADGRDMVLDSSSGATLLQAVSASCAVPGLMPPVTINGRRYMDGGVRVGAGADLAAGADHLVVIAPLAGLTRDRIRAEMAAVGAAKSLLIEPDEASIEAFGPSFMDPSRRAASVQAGLHQGEALAEAVRAVWPS